MTKYVESPHLQQWLTSGKAQLVPVEISRKLSIHINGLNWVGTRLDWAGISTVEADLSVMDDAELRDWVRQTSLEMDRYILFYFCADEPCIACELDFGISNIDYAYWKAPGIRYFFGADFSGGNWLPYFEHLIEYDGFSRIIASKRT